MVPVVGTNTPASIRMVVVLASTIGPEKAKDLSGINL